MKRYLPWTILTALLILLPIQAARAAAVTEIDDEEYAVYGAALGSLDTVFVSPVRCRSVFHETLSQHKLNAESIAELARQGSAPDLALIEDFNRKNARSALIAAGRLPAPFTLDESWTATFPSEGSVERLELSRVGFDNARKRALVVISHTFRGGKRAFHSSGGYMLLEKHGENWQIMRTAGGWASHY